MTGVTEHANNNQDVACKDIEHSLNLGITDALKYEDEFCKKSDEKKN